MLTRHLERVDTEDSSIEMSRIWNTLNKTTYALNPYLSDKVSKSTNKVIDVVNSKGCTVIYTSPFLRCIQTADIYAKELHVPVIVDHSLGEFVDEFIMYDASFPLDFNDIYLQSINYHSFPHTVIEKKLIFDKFETKQEYTQRIRNSVMSYPSSSLIVTHADSLSAFRSNGSMKYGEVYDIDIDIKIDYKKEYTAIKSKYLDIKKKQKLV